MMLVTEKAIIKYYSKDRVNHQKNAYKYIEAMELRKCGLGALRISRIIDMPYSAVNYWLLGGAPKSINGVNELKNMGLLPLEISNNLAFQQFIITLGFRYADGCIYEQKNNRSFSTYVCFKDKIDALQFCKDCKTAWNLNLTFHLNGIYYVYLPASLSRLMLSVGSPFGNKNYQNFRLPKWIFYLRNSLKWKFIDGLFSGDGQSPRLKKSGNACESLCLSLNSQENLVKDFCSGFMKDIYNLISSLGIKVTKPKIGWNSKIISRQGNVTYPVVIRILTEKRNMIRFLENVPYTYRKRAKINNILDGLKGKNNLIKLKKYLVDPSNTSSPQISVLLKRDMQKRLIETASNKNSDKNWGKYKELARYLKEKCNIFSLIDVSSIYDVYIPLWKKNKKFIPIECVIELAKINNIKISNLAKDIERLKILKTHNKYSIRFM